MKIFILIVSNNWKQLIFKKTILQINNSHCIYYRDKFINLTMQNGINDTNQIVYKLKCNRMPFTGQNAILKDN